jgi:hypothetical protein
MRKFGRFPSLAFEPADALMSVADEHKSLLNQGKVWK